MSVESTREVMSRYLDAEHDDMDAIAEDAVFTIMGTGVEYRGREAISGMLHYFYHVAFEATANGTNLVVDDGKAVLEADFTGKHTGEFMGIPPSGKEIHVPLCVVYDLSDNAITRGRVYFETDALRQQLGVQ